MFIILKLAYWNPIGVMIGAVMQLGNLYSVNSWRSENEDEGRGSGITQKHRNLFIYYGKKYPIANVKYFWFWYAKTFAIWTHCIGNMTNLWQRLPDIIQMAKILPYQMTKFAHICKCIYILAISSFALIKEITSSWNNSSGYILFHNLPKKMEPQITS